MRYLIVILPLLLGGCAEFAARAVGNAAYLAESSEDYVREVHDDRRWIRERCRELVREQINALIGEGKYDEARQLLANQYPSLVTFQLINDLDSDDGPLNPLNEPWPCLD